MVLFITTPSNVELLFLLSSSFGFKSEEFSTFSVSLATSVELGVREIEVNLNDY